MEATEQRPPLVAVDSSETTSSDDYDSTSHYDQRGRTYFVDPIQQFQYADESRDDIEAEITPMASVSSSAYPWHAGVVNASRARGGSGGDQLEPSPLIANGQHLSQRPSRPSVVRTPSNAYNPARRPHQYSVPSGGRHRTMSAPRNRKLANQQYHAQERAYVQRIRQDAMDNELIDAHTPELDYTESSENDEDSPITGDYVEDPYDQETLLYYGNEDMQPSVEELKIPEN